MVVDVIEDIETLRNTSYCKNRQERQLENKSKKKDENDWNWTNEMRKINGKYPKIEREKVKINWIKRVKNVWGISQSNLHC